MAASPAVVGACTAPPPAGRARACGHVSKCNVQSANLTHGIELFNDERFFEAHEVLEDVWRVAPQHQKKFLQGLVQLAVAFHHYSTGNLIGSRSVMARALRNLSSKPEGLHNLHTSEIVETFAPCQRALDENRCLAKLPKLNLHE